jgi:hypothetical protein
MKKATVNSRTALTFDEWVEHGYRVKGGMKSAARNSAGKATFTMKQVWFVPESKRDIYLAPPQSSATPPAEVAKAIAQKEKADEKRHEYIDPTFNAAEQEFEEGEEPPR